MGLKKTPKQNCRTYSTYSIPKISISNLDSGLGSKLGLHWPDFYDIYTSDEQDLFHGLIFFLEKI